MLDSSNYDKKKEYEKSAIEALKKNDLRQALYHVCQTAKYTFLLAEATQGKISQLHLQEANGWLAVARKLEQKLRNGSSGSNENSAGSPNPAGNGQFHTLTRPREKLSDVAGMEKVKQQFIDMVVTPLKHPDIADKYALKKGGGVLLYGPPGTGKTFIVKALAGELNAAFYAIKTSDIISKWAGESEKNLSALFAEARKNPLSVIFFDEIDALSPDRSGDMSNYERRLVNCLLAELDGIEAKDHPNTLLVIGATNRPEIVDSALMRAQRLGVKIRVDLPDFQSRRKIFELFFKKRNIDLTPALLDMLAARTDNFNCADVDNVAQQAVTLAFKREIEIREKNGSPEKVLFTEAFFEEVLKNISSSVNKKDIESIDRWEKSVNK